MAMSKLKCRGCGDRFKRETMLNFNGGNFHDIDCATAHSRKPKQQAKGKKLIDKAWRADTAERKKAAKTKGEWAKEAQQQFNRFIRMRDHGNACISCGNMPNTGAYTGGGGIHAGHYRSVGACLELRFYEKQVNIQCVNCNVHNSGNPIGYRVGLIEKIGIEAVDIIEGPHDPKRYDIKDYQRIKLKYKVKADELARELEHEQATV